MLGDKDALGQRIAALEAELVCAYSELACSQSEGTVGVHSLAAPVPVFAMGADGLCVAVNPAGSRMRTEICPGSHSFFDLFHPNSVQTLRDRLTRRWSGTREFEARLANGSRAEVSVSVSQQDKTRIYVFCV